MLSKQIRDKISSSAGAGDAGKAIVADSSGKASDTFTQLHHFYPLAPIEGFTLVYNSATLFDVGPGRTTVPDSSGLYQYGVFTLFGSTNLSLSGMRFSGTPAIAANQTWHIFIKRADSDGSITFGADSSPLGVNKPAGVGVRLIGSIMTNSVGDIRNWTQIGNRFEWVNATTDLNTSSLSTSSSNLVTLTVPTGIKLIAHGVTAITSTGNAVIAIGSPDINPPNSAQLGGASGILRVPWTSGTDTSGRVKCFTLASNVPNPAIIQTIGFTHPRSPY
jgi:hypothetical protein